MAAALIAVRVRALAVALLLRPAGEEVRDILDNSTALVVLQKVGAVDIPYASLGREDERPTLRTSHQEHTSVTNITE